MSSPARMQTGRPATDDLDSSIVTDTETTMVRVMVGYSDSARGMRLRLRFDDRELVVDERLSSVRMSSTGGHSANLALSGAKSTSNLAGTTRPLACFVLHAITLRYHQTPGVYFTRN